MNRVLFKILRFQFWITRPYRSRFERKLESMKKILWPNNRLTFREIRWAKRILLGFKDITTFGWFLGWKNSSVASWNKVRNFCEQPNVVFDNTVRKFHKQRCDSSRWLYAKILHWWTSVKCQNHHAMLSRLWQNMTQKYFRLYHDASETFVYFCSILCVWRHFPEDLFYNAFSLHLWTVAYTIFGAARFIGKFAS